MRMDLITDAKERMNRNECRKLIVRDIGELAIAYNLTPRQVCDAVERAYLAPTGLMDNLNYLGWSSQMILDAVAPDAAGRGEQETMQS